MASKLFILSTMLVIVSSCCAYYSDPLNCYTETVMNCRALYGRADNFNQSEYNQCDKNARELCCLLYPGSCYKR